MVLLISSFIGTSSLSHAISSNEFEVSVQCKDPAVKKDALTFFQKNIHADSTYKDISNQIKRYYFQWPIKDIQVRSEENGYHFTIELKSTVTDFEIKGNRFLDDAELVRELKDEQTLYQGDEEVAALLERTKTYYAYRGFPNAQIDLEKIPKKESGSVKIVIGIKENNPCIIQSIEFSGEENSSARKKVLKKFPWKNKMLCDQEKIQKRIVWLKEKYNKDYYYQFDIKNEKLEYLNSDHTVAKLNADLTVGTRIVVEFEGNQYSFERDELLKRAIFLDQEKKFNAGFENSAIQAIKDFYENRGYPFAEVKFQHKSVDGVLHLIFKIERGSIVRLDNVKFEGNRAIRQKKLIRQFWKLAEPVWTAKKLLVASEVPTIVDGLLAYYQSQGFLHTVFYEPAIDIQKEKKKGKILFKLREGEPSFFDDFNIRGNVFMKTRDIKKIFNVKKGDPIDPVSMREKAQVLEYEYKIKGFKYVKVKLPEVDDIVEGYNSYNVEISEGGRIRIGDIVLRGNYSTEDYVILRELKFKSGDLLNPNKINETRSRLLRLGFFVSISVDEKPREDLTDVEDVIFTVVEAKKRSVVVRPGVSTDEGGRLAGSLSYNNIAGTGRNTTLTGKLNHRFDSAAILEHRAILSYLEPKLFGFADGKMNLIHEQSEQDQFDISTTSFILGLENNYYRHFRATTQWQLEFRNPFNEQPGAVFSRLDKTKARFGSLAAILDVDYRDNILNAYKGTFHRFQFSYYDKFLLSDANFFQLNIRNNFYIPIYKRFRSVLSVRGGYSATFGKTKDEGIKQIPIEKRFRLGGNSSLRGFGLNCVGGLDANAPENCSDQIFSQAPGGNSMFNYLLDVLVPVSPSFDFVLFTDGGNAFLNNSDFDLFKIRTTAGFGIRYNTPVGPLRIDYGIKLDRRTGESFGAFHLAVGQF